MPPQRKCTHGVKAANVSTEALFFCGDGDDHRESGAEVKLRHENVPDMGGNNALVAVDIESRSRRRVARRVDPHKMHRAALFIC